MRKKSSYNSHAVIGLGFGDEGKGVAVNSLSCALNDSLVVRYSGGQQAGHTVTLKDGTSHVFSNFGSGTLKGVPTFWSKYCTFDPLGACNELDALLGKGFEPTLYLDKRSPITTPYDKYHNKFSSSTLLHGSCGVGVGATFAREEAHHSLTVGDLLFPSVLRMKLKLIQEYYGSGHSDVLLGEFLECCDIIRSSGALKLVDEVPIFENYIFEGSQGLLLDQDIGFFPHVTRSSVGSKNILEMGFEPNLYLITRAFQTRHGNGPMTNHRLVERNSSIIDNPNETNIQNEYQGEFRKSILDLDLLKYGIEKDSYIRSAENKALVVTCLDLLDEYCYTVNGRVIVHSSVDSFLQGISNYLGIEKVYPISSPDGIFEINDV